jgi:hypothetical protein
MTPLRLDVAPPPATLGDALALRPDLRAGYLALEAAFAAEPALDAAVRARVQGRIATLLGVAPVPTDAAPGDPVLEFAEQLVLDAHGVSDALVARLGAVLSPRGIVALAQAIAVWEGECRVARAFGVRPELG